MNLIDTNAVAYIFEQNIQCEDIYYLSPDVYDEVEMTQDEYGKKLPSSIKTIYDTSFFSDLVYIDFYKQMLNKHRGRSFFNMTGFGDISILATAHTLISAYQKEKLECLFDPTETIQIFTNDQGLIKRVSNEFSNTAVLSKTLEDIT